MFQNLPPSHLEEVIHLQLEPQYHPASTQAQENKMEKLKLNCLPIITKKILNSSMKANQ